MPYTYKDTDKIVKEGRSWVDDQGVTHPSAWTRYPAAYKVELGLTLIPPPERYDNRFYWSPNVPRQLEDKLEFEADEVTPLLDEKGDQIITRGLKHQAILKVKHQAFGLLVKTDWAIIRDSENVGKLASLDVTSERSAVRLASDNIEAAIVATTTLEEFIALYDTPVDAEDVPTGKAPISDWPELV